MSTYHATPKLSISLLLGGCVALIVNTVPLSTQACGMRMLNFQPTKNNTKLLMVSAQHAQDRNDLKSALSLYTKALHAQYGSNTDKSEAGFLAAQIAGSIGQENVAINLLKESQKRWPNNPNVQLALAQHALQNNQPRARILFTRLYRHNASATARHRVNAAAGLMLSYRAKSIPMPAELQRDCLRSLSKTRAITPLVVAARALMPLSAPMADPNVVATTAR